MTMTANLHSVTPTALVEHYADMRCAVINAGNGEGGSVALFFKATDAVSELAIAEAWLRDALAKVEVAKIDAANDQPAPVLPERVKPCYAEDSEGYVCTIAAGHAGPHEAWGGGESPESTWPADDQPAPVYTRPSWPCRAEQPEYGFRCTLPEDHDGAHVAHGPDDEAIATWPIEPAARIGEPLDLAAGAL